MLKKSFLLFRNNFLDLAVTYCGRKCIIIQKKNLESSNKKAFLKDADRVI